jgi:SAM-dependent methyltransferase
LSPKPHEGIISFCESLLAEYGDTPQGVGWFRGDASTRYRVLLELLRSSDSPVTLLDFGCGASHLYEHILRTGREGIVYSGLELSPRFLELSRKKFPHIVYHNVDILDPQSPPLPSFDYAILSGILTYRGKLTHAEMFDYLGRVVTKVFEKVTIGMAFNLITPQVDWEREDLFHMPVDPLLDFLSRKVSRHVVIRHDYGLYEYTVYVYKNPTAPEQSHAKRLLDEKDSR